MVADPWSRYTPPFVTGGGEYPAISKADPHKMAGKFSMSRQCLILILVAGWLVAGCAAGPAERDVTRPAEQMYQEARESIETFDWPEAIDRLNALEARYPFGEYARQAQLDLIMSHHQQREWDTAQSVADRFLNDNPGDAATPWVLYMKGLVSFDRTVGFLERSRWRRDRSPMDPSHARQAFENFSLLTRRFPDSEYAGDARQRMIYLRNRLARHEYHIAEYYYRRGAWVASANRAAALVGDFQGAEIIPEALQLLEKAYLALDMEALAMDTRAVYEESFGTTR